MNKLATLVGLLLISTMVDAAVISRTYTYTDGNTISANENNTNENTIYNEFNGNIEAANIKDGTITSADVADTQFTRTKFASAVQSTFTYVDALGAYRRPNLSWVSVTTVDIENNTGTSNETCIFFPDEKRCVTENTSSTSVNRRFIVTETASLSGTKNSGLAPGETEAASAKYALYAVKATDSSTDFVIVGTTNPPTQGRFATLNTLFGTNGWIYIGTVWNGDGSGNSDIIAFVQSGAYTTFVNTYAGAISTQGGYGVTNTGGATTLTYTLTSANTGNGGVPSNVLQVNWGVAWESVAGNVIAQNSGANRTYITANANSTLHINSFWSAASEGVKLSNGPASSEAMDIIIRGYFDGALGIGYNPQI